MWIRKTDGPDFHLLHGNGMTSVFYYIIARLRSFAQTGSHQSSYGAWVTDANFLNGFISVKKYLYIYIYIYYNYIYNLTKGHTRDTFIK